MVNDNTVKTKAIVILIFSFLALLLATALFLNKNNLRTKAAPGIPALSFAVQPSPLQSGQNFDLILKVNPNNASFNAFELYFFYDPAKVEFQNADPVQNTVTPYTLLRAEVNNNTSMFTVIGTKIGGALSGSADIELARVKMRVVNGATGTVGFNWDPGTRLGNKIARELLDSSFTIGSGGSSGGPDLFVDIPSVVTPPGGVGEVLRGQRFDAQLFLKTGANQVKSLDFILPYDDTILTFPDLSGDLTQNIVIEPNSGFNTQFVIKKVDTAAKRIIVSLVVPMVNQNPVPVSSTSDILLATIKFTVRQDAPFANFNLLPDSASLIFNPQDQNILSCVGGFRLGVVQSSTFTPAPSPSTEPTLPGGGGPAGLSFMVTAPNIAASTIQFFDAEVKLISGTSTVETVNTTLVKTGSYFRTDQPIFFNNAQSANYQVFVKTRVTVGRLFFNVNLIPNQTLDCTVSSNASCGDFISERDTKILLSGDSDGFDTSSGSYNKIDSADLQVITIYFNQVASGGASAGDFNLDGQVNISDLEILGRNYGQNGD